MINKITMKVKLSGVEWEEQQKREVDEVNHVADKHVPSQTFTTH